MLNCRQARETAQRVSEATAAADAGVVVTVGKDSEADLYILWAIAPSGHITCQRLSIAETSEERLTAHARGFVQNHLAMWAARVTS
jgi:hypothetical protein